MHEGAHRVRRPKPQVEGEQHKEAIVVEADAVVHPGTVVIHSQHTPAAMTDPSSLLNSAYCLGERL